MGSPAAEEKSRRSSTVTLPFPPPRKQAAAAGTIFPLRLPANPTEKRSRRRKQRVYFTLPNDNDAPAQRRQSLLVAHVALRVPAQFLFPKFAPMLRNRRLRTILVPMPETSVHENHRPILLQHNVGRSRKRPVTQPKPKPRRMKQRTHTPLRPRVAAANARHVARPRFRRNLVRHAAHSPGLSRQNQFFTHSAATLGIRFVCPRPRA